MRMCTPSDMHPYECDGEGNCIHCDKRDHDVSICALCIDSIPRIDYSAEKLSEDIHKKMIKFY